MSFPEPLLNMEPSDNTYKLKIFAKHHHKNVGKNVVILQNVSFIQLVKFFLPLHIENKCCFNLSSVYILKLYNKFNKEELLWLFVLYEDIEHNTDNRENVAAHWYGEREEKKFSRNATFCFTLRQTIQYRQ